MTREKVTNMLAKMKAQVEGAKAIGSESEAQAFAGAMQRLMLQHAISEAEVEAARDAKDAPEPIIEHQVNYETFGLRTKKKRIEWMESLAWLVSQAHLCRWLLSKNSNKIWFVGTRTHATAAEMAFGTLAALLDRMSEKQAYYYKLKCSREGLGQSAANGFRQAFLEGFLQRLRQRYADERRRVVEETKVTHAEVSGSPFALMVINTAVERVESYIGEKFGKDPKHKPAAALKPRENEGQGAARGYNAGREAANQVDLTGSGPRKLTS